MSNVEEVCCEECGSHTELFLINEMYLCENCLDELFPECHDCGERVSSDDMNNTGYGHEVCNDCLENYSRCEECGEMWLEDDIHYSERIDGYVCNDCWDDDIHSDRINERYICDYHDSGEPKAWLSLIEKDGQMVQSIRPSILYHYIGIELEVEGERCRSLSEKLRDDIDPEEYLFRMEYDGSVDGFEIITNPMTYGYFRKMYPVEKILKECKRYGFTSHDNNTCGLHIHMSKNAFGESHAIQKDTIVKCVYLLEKFSGKWHTISRRGGSCFGHYTTLYNVDIDCISFDDVWKKRDRYRILSIRDETIELRMFKGTLNPDSFRAAIDLYYGLVGICRQYDLKYLKYMSWDEIRYLICSMANTKELYKYMEKRLHTECMINDHDIQVRLQAIDEMYHKIEEEREMSFTQVYQEVLPVGTYVDNRYMPDEIRYHIRMPECPLNNDYYTVYSMTGRDTGIMLINEEVNEFIGAA